MRVRKRNSLLEGIVYLKRTAPSINLTAMIVFFYVAENPGINMAVLAEVCGITLSAASRTSRSLGPPDVEGSLPPFYGLVDVFDNPRDPRGRNLQLSERGRLVCEQIDLIIAAASQIFEAS
jgi:DNA-binding MarR family transcriptional regulator